MPGLVPGIRVFFALNWKKQDADGGVKPGHDETGVFRRMAPKPRLLSGPFGPK